jgi:hypothetical protein
MIKGVSCAEQMVMMLVANGIRRNDEERFCTQGGYYAMQ